jgi:hypothetical protein
LFVERQVLFFRPFYFKDGGAPENKFFVILKNIDNVSIVASLPTKVNNAKSLINIPHGCINIDDRKFSCYIFEAGRPVCENGFYFKLPTHMYGDQVNDYQLDSITKGGTIKEGVEYDVAGFLTEVEFTDIYKCLSDNNSTKGRIKRLLKK